MAKQTINIGTSPNKGDGDPIRTAFDKVNDNFTELYSDVKQLNSVNFGGGTFTSDVIGTVFAHDSTMLIDANDGEIVGPLASTSWQTNNAIDIDSTTGDIDITAAGVLTLEHSSQDDYIKIDNSGVEIFSDGTVEIKSQGTDIQIGYDTTSGDVQIGHNSSNLFVNGTLTVNAFSKLVPPDYDTVARNGLAAVDGQMIFNTDTEDLEVYFNGVWKNATTTDVGDLTDNGNVIPTDVSDLTDTTVIIKSDVSQLTDNSNRIPTDIGDLLSGGNTGDVVTRTAVGYGWTAPSYFGGAFSDLTSTPTTIAGYGITDAVALTGLSVSTASAGSAALAYNNSTGEFTFTPPDLSSYLTSVAGTVTASLVPDTDEAYDLGSSTLKFRDLYLSGTSINLGSATITASGATVTLPANSTIGGTDTISTFDSAFSSLTGTPTTIAGYGITDAVEDFADLGVTPTTISGYGITDAFDGAFSSLTGKPTTIAGYGITDATSTASPAFTGAVDFTGATSVDFTGATITGTSFLTSYTETDPVVGAITGLVKSDGAGNISAAVAGTDYSTFDGAFGSLSGTPTTLGGYGITDAATTGTETTFTKDVHFDRGVEEKFQTLTGQSGVVQHNWNDGHVFYHTTPAGDITANFINVNLTAEYATNVTIIINQGATPYEVTAVQIAGAAQTINWQGGSAPTGTANGIDSFSFTILNDGGSYVVLGQMVDFT